MIDRLVSPSNFRKSIVILGIVLMGLIFFSILNTPKIVIKRTNYYFLLLAFGASLGVLVCEVLRFISITRISRETVLSVKEAIAISLSGVFFAKITPGGAGGEPFQLYMLNKNGIKPGKGTAVLIINGIASLVSRLTLLFLLPVIAFRIHLSIKNISMTLLLYFSGIFMFLFILSQSRLINNALNIILKNCLVERIFGENLVNKAAGILLQFFTDFHNASSQLKKSDWFFVVLTYIFITIGWIMTVLVPYFILKGLYFNPPFLLIFTYTLITRSLTDFIPTPGSSFVQEAGIALIFNQLVGDDMLWLFILLWKVFLFYLTLLITGIITIFKYGVQVLNNNKNMR